MAKSKYDPAKLVLIEGWARDGLTDAQIAKNLGVNVATLYRWKERYREICEALQKGKEIIDYEVENALLKSALGFEYTEEVVTNRGDVVAVTRVQAPSNTAQIFWLKNRKPKEWRDRRELEHSSEPGKPVEVSHDVHGHLDDYLDAIAQIVRGLPPEDDGADGAPQPLDSG